MNEIIFTHYWVTDFGWENTIYQPSDFKEVEKLGENDIDGIIFYGRFSKSGKTHILKGFYKNETK
jgi:hypothetical protein